MLENFGKMIHVREFCHNNLFILNLDLGAWSIPNITLTTDKEYCICMLQELLWEVGEIALNNN